MGSDDSRSHVARSAGAAGLTGARLGRRRLLQGLLGMAGGAVVMTACGGASVVPTPTPPAPSAATPTPASAATSTPAPQAGTTPAPTSPAAATPAAAATPTPAAATSGSSLLINGAGSSFDNPLFSKAFSEYSKLNPKVKVNYQSVGSGAGIQQFTKGTVDFGATDAPMSDQQIADAGGDVIHLPVTLGPVALAYNLPGVAEGIKLSGPVLADIYLGKLTVWNDPAIAKLNPEVKLPDTPIAVVHRSDGSGTTDIFTSYLSAISAEWKQKVGLGTSVNWPVGLGGKGSEGVAGAVKQTPGGIGYFELAYAKQNSLTSAAIDDGTGSFVLPSPDGTSLCAANAAGAMPADLRIRIAGCGGTAKGAYPISGMSWVVLHQKQKDAAMGTALANLLWWLIHDGQKFAKDLSYAPLPDPVVRKGEEKLRSVTVDGKPALSGG